MSSDDAAAAPRELREAAAEVARTALAPMADVVDRECLWPEHAFRALARAGLMGLHIPRRLGGLEQGLLALAVVTEELAVACPSSAMCYGMHCVGSKVIAAKATPDQEARYLHPIAEGRHITSLALSETGTGAHFYVPQTVFAPGPDGHYLVNGSKSFVTSGGHADSYVISAVAPGPEQDPGTFSCFVVEKGTPGLEWLAPWQGFGMRGNSSRTVRIDNAAVPRGNLLGAEGDELWYVFDVVAPFFLTAMSAAYVGIARAALELAIEHLRGRRHDHSGEALTGVSVLADEVASAWIRVTRARQLLHHAARLGDAGDAAAREALLASKVEVAEAAVAVTNAAMSLGGGRAYEANAKAGQLLRDARAAHVMAPTTQILKTWLGRSLLGLPLL